MLLIVSKIGYLPITGGGNLSFQLVNAWYEKGSMIPASTREFTELGYIFGNPVAATAPIDRLLHHASAIQIEEACYRLRNHADLNPEHVRATAPIVPPPLKKKKRRRLGKKTRTYA